MARDTITAMCHPIDKMSAREFVDYLQEKIAITKEAFIANMEHLGHKDFPPEHWLQVYAAWAEFNE